MYFEQLYLGCLAHASYILGSEGEAVVVDPRRDVDVYLRVADERGFIVRHVVETHLHADFVSGHCELARRTGARIHVGERARVGYEHRALADGEELEVGRIRLRFLATPGHTPESVCVLVTDLDAPDAPAKLLTGDTLFIGDVGRPDLVAAAGRGAGEMAGMLYDSLREKILTLPDRVEVWPAHGAGSACGKNISQERSSTIGEQRRTNWALQPMDRETFVAMATAGLGEAPSYFAHDAAMNRAGARALGELAPVPELDGARVAAHAEAGAALLDVRPRGAYARAHLRGSLHVALDGKFASWAGQLVGAGAPIVLVAADRAQVAEARLRLARVGLENVVGALAGDAERWRAPGLELASIEQISVAELAERLAGDEPPLLLDVRAPGEHADGHVPGALSIPLPELRARAGELDPRRPTAVICASGYRSSTATSLLEASGLRELANVEGGTPAWLAEGRPAETAAAV